MQHKHQKFIVASVVTLAAFGGFEALIYIVNLYQIKIFLWLALAIWLYLWVKISFLYDLHFKNKGALKKAIKKHESISHWLHRSVRICLSAVWDRFEHFRKWESLKQWLNYLLLPGLIFWSTVAIFYLNLGRFNYQQIFAGLSSLSLVVSFWHIKEIYTAQEERISFQSFAALSAVKIYASLVSYGAAMHYAKYNCDFISPWWFVTIVFCVTFLLIYQALFQHKYNNTKNLFLALLIAITQSTVGYAVFTFWGYEYLTAAIFLAAFYNMLWGIFHHNLEGTLSRRVFWETVIVSIFIAVLAVSVTNFRAQILPEFF